jgi:hypothetical protein
VRAMAQRRQVETFEHELWLWFFAGIVRQRFADSRPGQRRAVARVESGL